MINKIQKENIVEQLNKLIKHKDLSADEVRDTLNLIFSGSLDQKTEFTLGSFLSLISAKGPTKEEIEGLSNALNVMAPDFPKVEIKRGKSIAAVGSGKDEFKTINVTTTASIVAASLGAKIAKIGCGAESSAAGTTDILSLLNYPTYMSFKDSLNEINKSGFGFFNPELPMHQLFDYYIGRSLIFNPLEFVLPMYLGIETDGLLYGLSNPDTEISGNLLLSNGYNDTLIVCGQSNNEKYFDEISSLGKTRITKVNNGEMQTFDIRPEDLGIKVGEDKNLIQPEKREDCVKIVKNILRGNGHSQQNDIVAMNSGALLWISDVVDDLEKGISMSLTQIESRKVWKYFSTTLKNISL